MNKKMLELIPEVTELDLAFSTFNTIPELLKMAEEGKFDSHHNEYNRYFTNLFFNGGQIKFKENLNKREALKVLNYFKALSSSFSPKHEHKTAVCAFLLSEIVELPTK